MTYWKVEIKFKLLKPIKVEEDSESFKFQTF